MKIQQRAEKVLAQGSTGTNSKRPSQYVEGVYPTHLKKADGCYVWDVDGNKYIDFVGGLGTQSLGYNHPKVNEAVAKQIAKGINTSSLPDEIEVECAEVVCETFNVDKIRFLKTGNEATAGAIRIARSYNGKKYVISEGYHGHHEMFTSLTPPALGIKDQFLVTSDFTPGPDVACYITEGLYLDASKKFRDEITQKFDANRSNGGINIIDEIVTGTRVPDFCVNSWWNLDADIICLGKGIANGFPLSVIGGKKDVMDCGEYFISSTFSGESISLAACIATIKQLKENNMQELFDQANEFVRVFNEIANPIGTTLEGYGTRAMLNTVHKNTGLLMQECVKKGIILGKAFFYNFSHLEQRIDQQVLQVVEEAVRAIQAGKVHLEGSIPQETFKR
ncbi:MAG: aminotransferase class III-fold pyridoxal phosphate-dependent enzyme [Deltaproteobacteria bacterium]|nr:aminotransferase class III-fold pyridoxal phosphate-dependent enzyme [Deltaproteobacteria bacterium]